MDYQAYFDFLKKLIFCNQQIDSVKDTQNLTCKNQFYTH